MTVPDSLSSSFRANTSSNFSDGSSSTVSTTTTTDPISSYQPPASAPQSSPLKPKSKWKMWVGGLVMLILVAGGAAGYYLFQQNQDIRQQAYEITRCNTGDRSACGYNGCLGTQQRFCTSSGTWGGCTNSVACGYGSTPVNQPCGSHPHQSQWCNGNTIMQCENGTEVPRTDCPHGCNGGICNNAPPPPPAVPSNCSIPGVANIDHGQSITLACGSDGCPVNNKPRYFCTNGSTSKSCVYDAACNITCYRLNESKTACSAVTALTATCPTGQYATQPACEENIVPIGGTANRECYRFNGTNCVSAGLFEDTSTACTSRNFYNSSTECTAAHRIECYKYNGSSCVSAGLFEGGTTACTSRGFYSTSTLCLSANQNSDFFGACEAATNRYNGCNCTTNSQCQTDATCSNGICAGGTSCGSPVGRVNSCACAFDSQCISDNCSGGVCASSNTNTEGDQTTQTPEVPTGNLCLDGSGQTIIRSDVYTCPNGDTNGDGQCTSGDAGYTYATHNGVYTTAPTGVGDCWQIDYYSVDLATSQSRWGANSNDPAGYCGHAGNPQLCQKTSTPPPGPIGPMCLNIKMTNATTAGAAPKMGDQVTFACGQVAGVTNYQFRIRKPGGQAQEVSASAAGSNISQAVTVDTVGTYYAQCQVCNANGCSGWENLPTN